MKRVICIILITIVFFSCNPASCFDKDFIVSSKEIQEYTQDELVSCFQENQELFHNVASIILLNEKIAEEIKEKNDDDWAIYMNSDHRFFTDPEWDLICELFEKTGPYQIMRSLKFGHDVVYFVYMSDRKYNKSFELFFVPDNNEQTIMDYKWKNQTALQIEESWWIICET